MKMTGVGIISIENDDNFHDMLETNVIGATYINPLHNTSRNARCGEEKHGRARRKTLAASIEHNSKNAYCTGTLKTRKSAKTALCIVLCLYVAFAVVFISTPESHFVTQSPIAYVFMSLPFTFAFLLVCGRHAEVNGLQKKRFE